MHTLTFDTNILAYYFNNEEWYATAVDALTNTAQTRLVVSVITEMELLSKPSSSSGEIMRINDYLRTARIIPVDSELAQYAASLRRKHGMQSMDAIIAATALLYSDGWLWSLDRVFRKIPELRLYDEK